MSVAPTNQTRGDGTPTLGELLYADPQIVHVSEKEWLAVVRAIAAGDEAALRLLYEKAFPVVFTYLMRLTGDRRVTDTLVVDVFQMVWCEAPLFDAADGPVLAWIMRQARSRALDHAGNRNSPNSDSGGIGVGIPPYVTTGEGGRRAPAGLLLPRVLEVLTMEERQAIEAVFLDGSSYAELAARSGQPVGTIKSRIRSGLAKLQQALQAPGEKA